MTSPLPVTVDLESLKRRYRILKRTGPALETEGRRLLGYYHVYRLVLAAIFFALATAELVLELPARHTLIFTLASLAMVLAALAGLYVLRLRRPPLYLQAHLAFLSDIALLGILVYTRDDLLGILYVPLMIAVGGASLMFPPRVALAYAALCSLMILFKRVLDLLELRSGAHDLLTSGVVGLGFFTTALAVGQVAARARRRLELVDRQRIDLNDMDQINRVVAENIDLGVVAIDRKGSLRFANGVARRQLDLPDAAGRLPGMLQKLLERSAPETSETTPPIRFDYNHRQLSLRAIGLGSGSLLLIDDETLTNQRTQQIRFASLGRMAGEIAHEIRNPLSAIQHAAQLLEGSTGGGENAQLLGIIRGNTARINAIIDSILDLGHARKPRAAKIRLRGTLQKLAGQCRQAADPAEPRIVCKGEEVAVGFDPLQLEQVITNLCQNALQHGGKDGRAPRITLRTGVDADGRPFLDVIDDGPGVQPELVEQMFEPFTSGSPQGTGLGLYISRRLCEMNHAQLEYLADDTGHRFRITFRKGENADG